MRLNPQLRIGLLGSLRASLLGSAFSPASLFAAGESGYWLDPSDFSTMFQDSAGTTPVTATGQPVGFLGDKSQGFALGPELVTNGNFDSATGWTLSGTASISAGKLNLPAISDRAAFAISGLIAGQIYVVSLEYNNIPPNNGGASCGIDASATNTFFTGGAPQKFYGSGSATLFVVAGSTPAFFKVALTNAGTPSGTTWVDNISVRELPGNHFLQATAGNRPILGVEPAGGRRNLLTYTEQFDNTAWNKIAASVTTNVAVAPDGTTTADRIVPTATTAQHYVQTSINSIASTYTMTVYAKADGYRWLWFNATTTGAPANDLCWFDVLNGVTGTAQAGATTSIQSVGNGWFRCVCSWAAFTVGNPAIWIAVASADNQSGGFTGDGTSGILIWGAQLELGSTATDYQRVTDQWNVTEAGVTPCYYLAFDGTDDRMLSAANINPGGVDKAQVFVGARSFRTTSGTEAIADAGSVVFASNGWWELTRGSGGLATVNFASRGTTTASTGSPNVAVPPWTAVLTGLGDIGAPSVAIRADGVQIGASTATQGTGDYTTLPHAIGSKTNGSSPFNGRIYQTVMRYGPNLDAAQIDDTEDFVAIKTGFFAPQITGVPTIS